MPADKPLPLPTPPNLHALQNRIALSLSARASLLSRSSPSSSAQKPKSAQQLQQQQHGTSSSPSIAEEPDLRSLGDANAGVGYVPEGQDALAAQAGRARDKVLRGRILGKRPNGDKANEKGLLRRAGEESDDEDLGRSALGRKKAAGDGGGRKKRKRPVGGEDDENDGVNGNNGGDGVDNGAAGAEVAGRSGVADDTSSLPQEVSSGGELDMATSTQAPAAAHNETTEVPLREKKKNKKNKNKKKRKQGLP